MPSSSVFHAQPWLESPLRTPIGEIELAGLLENITGIDPARMRILGKFALVLMVSGEGYYRDVRGFKADLSPGDVVCVFPEIAHAYGPVPGGDWSQVYFVFDGSQFELWRQKGLLSPDRPVWRLGSPDYWHQRLADVLKSEPLHGEGAPLRTLGRFLQVVTEMIAADAENVGATRHEAWLEKGLRLLGERGADGWLAPQAVARQVGLNYENFRKRFTRLTGESPGRYQKRRRLEWARAAIYHGDLSLKQIADTLGFCDVFHFSKAFKQEIGLTPSDYRKRVRG